MQINGSVVAPRYNVKDRLVKNRDGTCREHRSIWTRESTLRNPPVTPAIVRGWAPKTENMNAAMKEDISTSATPYWLVVSIRSRLNAIPGSTLRAVNERAFPVFANALTWQRI